MNVFLFVTANKYEREAFEKRFINYNENYYVLGKTYYMGKFGHYSAAYIHIEEQGVTAPAAILLVEKLIQKLKPIAVIMVGIAFGVDESKQKIGDVLVSDKILPYDSQKILESETIYKEIPKEVGFQLLNAFREYREWNYLLQDSVQSVVHIGSILTGSKLINNYEFRSQLLKDFSDYKPIGGEMEAQGIYSACKLNRVAEWIIVKGICDWGYKKEDNKNHYQTIAANAAVDYCFHIFSRKGVFNELLYFDESMDINKSDIKNDNIISNISHINNENHNGGNVININAGKNTVINLGSSTSFTDVNDTSVDIMNCSHEDQKNIQENSEMQIYRNKLSKSEDYISTFEYERAIHIINDIISNIKGQCNSDCDDILIDCYRLKCIAYKALGGNGNSLFAILCNKAKHTLL